MGTLVTMAVAVSVGGNSVPRFFVFPYVHYKKHFVLGDPPGSVGSANLSGYVTDCPNPVIKDTVPSKLSRMKTNETNLPFNTSSETAEVTLSRLQQKPKRHLSLARFLLTLPLLLLQHLEATF
ncbi:hypothetical protein ILUMI_06151 [Ignelater luminosus]|uniref:Uncharacterized protein n=1 Tax=Ignelater luminosus TaxID=2038154 RepID=A0A8K0DAJ8_IGNLU|nr:hypothetical protein ILUMI_06151 [Ignelater luminosus]